MRRVTLYSAILAVMAWHSALPQSFSISSGLQLVECPPDGIPEQEACGEDINGGCDAEPDPGPENSQPIECGTTICGTGWADGGLRDTDWYRLTLAESATLTVSGEAEFPFELAIIIPGDPDPCVGFTVLAIEQASEGEVFTLQVPVNYEEVWIRAGDSGLDGNPCGDDDDDYYITVDCQPCEDYITIEIETDSYPEETSWELIERESGTVVAAAGPLSDPLTVHIWQVCADRTLCYDWYIYDSFGDGIHDYGGGYYMVFDFDGELLCTGGWFGYVDVCPDIGTCLPQTGACCIELECVGDMEEGPCVDAGGTWHEGETCDDFTCPEPPIGCGEAVYHNGTPPAYGAYFSQCDPVYPFQSAAADDFVLEGEDDILVTSIVGWVAHWNYPGAEPTPADYDGVSVTIYNHDEANARPGGNPIDGDPECAIEGDYAYHRIYGPGEFDFFPDIDAGVWRLEFPVEDLCLQPGVTYWVVWEPIMQFGVWGQGGPVPIDGQTGSLPMLYWTGMSCPGWWCANIWPNDFGFCINGELCSYADCVYIPGDCNHNGVPIELGDVIAMIGMYRGTVVPPYECVCPPHEDNFTPTADPNGNCVANELADAVTEIAAYRGSDTVSGCPDCPGLRRLLPGGDDHLKSIKTGFPK